MNLQKQTYFSVSSSRAPTRNTADYSPFGVQLDGRTLSYVPPAPAPPSVTVVYQHKFDDNPSTHPYTTAPNQLNTKLTNVSWTNSQSSWTNFAGFTGKAIATNSATPDTTRLYLNLTVNSGFMMDVKSYSFYHRSSTTGYTNYQLLVNGVLVGSGSIFVSSGSTLQSSGTINVANAIAGLTGSVTVTLKLFGGSNGNNATFRLDDFTLNGYTQEVQVYAESYRRGFNGMEKDEEVKGGGNSYDFGARIYDARVGRWLTIDPLSGKYPSYTPYSFCNNNGIIYIDPDGKDIVYFDSKGNEESRVVSNTVFKTFVAVEVKSIFESNSFKGTSVKYYAEAKMPNRIIFYSKYEKSQKRDYNKFDYDIAAQTFIFNSQKKQGKLLDKGKAGDPSDVPDLDPNIVKSIIIKETLYGSIKSKNGGVDIMQTNVTGDWDNKKSELGLTKGTTNNYQESIKAGIMWLYWKGISDANGVENVPTWSGGDNWENAIERYNGGGDSNYMAKFKQIQNTLKHGCSVDGSNEIFIDIKNSIADKINSFISNKDKKEKTNKKQEK